MMRLRLILAVLLLSAFAYPSSSDNPPIQVTVLSAQTHSSQEPAIVTRGCSFWDYDAYCLNSAPVTYIENTMLIRKPDGTSEQIACKTPHDESSECAALPVNQTFAATEVKNGLKIRYQDKDGKTRKQVYEIVNGSEPEAK